MKTEHSAAVGTTNLRTGKSSAESTGGSPSRLKDTKGAEAMALTPSTASSRERPADNTIPRKRKRTQANSPAADAEAETHTDADKICWAPASSTEAVQGLGGAANISDGSDDDDDPHLHSPITDVRQPENNPVECA